MIEEQNIPGEESIDNNSQQHTDVSSQTQTSNQKSETVNMEAHHPHHITHKKKWTEYLLEFFMLFLAVFLGFDSENIRESSVHSSHMLPHYNYKHN